MLEEDTGREEGPRRGDPLALCEGPAGRGGGGQRGEERRLEQRKTPEQTNGGTGLPAGPRGPHGGSKPSVREAHLREVSQQLGQTGVSRPSGGEAAATEKSRGGTGIRVTLGFPPATPDSGTRGAGRSPLVWGHLPSRMLPPTTLLGRGTQTLETHGTPRPTPTHFSSKNARGRTPENTRVDPERRRWGCSSSSMCFTNSNISHSGSGSGSERAPNNSPRV